MQNISEIMKPVDIMDVEESAVKLIGKEWMLITPGNPDDFNTMTASWGGLGELWNKNVAFTFIRPQRYTFGFAEEHDFFSLSFLPKEYRKALAIAGSKSGRDCDKVSEAGITPVMTDNGVAFAESRLVLECKKLYAGFLDAELFIDKSILKEHYPENDLHKMYIGEIFRTWIKK